MTGFDIADQLDGADINCMARQNDGRKLGGAFQACLSRAIRKHTEFLNPAPAAASAGLDTKALADAIHGRTDSLAKKYEKVMPSILFQFAVTLVLFVAQFQYREDA